MGWRGRGRRLGVQAVGWPLGSTQLGNPPLHVGAVGAIGQAVQVGAIGGNGLGHVVRQPVCLGDVVQMGGIVVQLVGLLELADGPMRSPGS